VRLEELRQLRVLRGLSDTQLGELFADATEVSVQEGVVLFQQGEPADSWWVLLEGAIDLVRHIGREDVVVAQMDSPGRWAGGFRAWDEHGVYLATGRGASSGRVLEVSADVLRECADAWFPFGAHLIEGLYHTARSIESTARQRDSLVTLGTLAAGLAHELNNPAAAATRAVDALGTTCDSLLATLTSLAENRISAEQFSALDTLRREIRPRADAMDALELADAEDALSTWLGRHGVGREWVIAPPLAAAGVDPGWCDRVAAQLPEHALEPALEWVSSTLSAAKVLFEVKASTRRISDLVASVKSYSQLDRASLQEVDVTDGLESTLVMLGHKLRDGITVVRDYGEGVPRVLGYPGELNQVWTNLIDNAADVMAGGGTLRLTTRFDEGHLIVEVADTGEGMPPEVARRAFEAFYTTKDVGHGTGLGLDIARRIVEERHGGTIAIDSKPGGTVLRVRLPRRPAGADSGEA
jgi:signal transduction histidine kinase